MLKEQNKSVFNCAFMKSEKLYRLAKEAEVEELKDALANVNGKFDFVENGGPYVEYTGGDYNHDVEVMSVKADEGFIIITAKDADSGEYINATVSEFQYGHLDFITSSIKGLN